MLPGARMLLLTTEDNFAGAWTSRIWCCRTYNRRELARICEDVGLRWHRELWFTRMHKVFAPAASVWSWSRSDAVLRSPVSLFVASAVHETQSSWRRASDQTHPGTEPLLRRLA